MVVRTESLLGAKTAEELWHRFIAHMADFGFSNVLYFARGQIDTPQMILASDPVVFHNLREPHSHRVPQSDPGIAALLYWAHGAVGARSFPWLASDDAKAVMNNDAVGLMPLLARHDIAAGYVVSLQGVIAHGDGVVLLNP